MPGPKTMSPICNKFMGINEHLYPFAVTPDMFVFDVENICVILKVETFTYQNCFVNYFIEPRAIKI